MLNVAFKLNLCSPVTEEKFESKKEVSDPEEQVRGADGGAAASQPQRVPLFPGMDPSALKVSQQLCTRIFRKRDPLKTPTNRTFSFVCK